MNSKTFATAALTLLTTSSLLFNARADILTGLVGYWPFDEGRGSAIANDSSGHGNNGMLTNFSDTTYKSMWTNGYIGDAILFNTNGAISNFVSVPNSATVNFSSTKAFTLAAWVYLSVDALSQSNGACIICKGVSGNEAYCLDINNGSFRVSMRNSSGNSLMSATSATIPVAGTWYHVAGTYITPGQPHEVIYVNGVADGTSSGTLTTVLSNTTPMTIGGRASSNGVYNIPFQGIIDEVHIYNRALSASDINELYSSTNVTVYGTNYAPNISTQPRNVAAYFGDTPVFGVTLDTNTTLFPVYYQWYFNGTNIAGATNSSVLITNAQATNQGAYSVMITNLVGTNFSSNAVLTLQSLPTADTTTGLAGWWKFDDGSGSATAADSSANGNTGALTGFADTTYSNMWTSGIIGGALAFNGDSSGQDVVAIPNEGSPAPDALDFSTNPVFTLTAWVQGARVQANGAGIIAKGYGGGGEQYVVDIFGGNGNYFGGYYRFYVIDTNGTVFTAQTAVAPSGGWQQLATVLNGNTGIMNFYINGALAAEAVAPFSVQSNSHELSIGNRQPGSGNYGDAFTGILDDVRVYNRDLTSADVTALYSATRVPLVITGLPTNQDLVAGVYNVPLTLNATVTGGLPPFSYQWQFNGSNISGATTNFLILTNAPAEAGAYDLIVSDSGYVPAVTSSVVAVAVVPELTFNGNGANWSAQGNTFSWLGNNVAQLTADFGSESNSAFYSFPLYVGAFQASFTYTVPTGSSKSSDGLTFCIQNDPRGAAAIGGPGGSLGVSTITPSVEFEFNINGGNGKGGVGVTFDTNGAIGHVANTSPLIIDAGDPINTTFTYQAGVATVTLTDTNAGTEFSISTNVDIASVLGTNVAFIGFTGADGSLKSTQQISDFTFISLVNLTIQTSSNTALISWPAESGGYVLQQNSDLTTTNWMNVTNAATVVNGTNQVTVPITASARFYQLLLE